MNSINELDHPLYKSSLTRTQNIDGKLKKTRLNCLINNCSIVGTKNDILLHLKGGPAKNLINTFFKYTTDKCDYCGIQKSKTIQLDRAHCNKDSCDRSSLLQRSINYHFIDQSAPIKIKDILITFVKYHKDIPLFILCKKCHREYDK
mgnify:CR=1 FL=1|tara:strand:+ start:612 stop:1052 length:441 start_codon:yes stop_codon:yes gene_type:complete